MTDHMPDDVSVQGKEPRAYTDTLRPRHGVVRNRQGEWVLLRHALVVQAAQDHERFSSAVSSHLHVPNGLDGEEHRAYREALDVFLTAEAIAPFGERFRRVAADLFASLPRGVAVDAVWQVGARFAVRAQSAWLSWPGDLEDRLVAWVAENHAATRSGEAAWTRRVAHSFDEMIRDILARCHGNAAGNGEDTVIARLTRTEVNGRRLTQAQVVSVLRNWTGGDLGSMALCVGVLVHALATHATLQGRLRLGMPDAELDAVIDEILRIDNPFVSNRRVTTCPVTIGGAHLPARARVKLNWTSANRDAVVFGEPDVMDPQRNAAHNLVYGIGKHVCPGRLLATMQMRIALRELLAATSSLALDPMHPPERAISPVGGWGKVPVVLT